MWNEPLPQWRTARKQYQCQGDGCAEVIAPGERYLDRTLRDPEHSHLRYCQECAEPIIASANSYHFFRRTDFPERYQKRVSSTEWKNLRRKIIEQRGNRCQHCGSEGSSLALHHVHYRSLEQEQSEDVELLCGDCHSEADKAREAKGRPGRD